MEIDLTTRRRFLATALAAATLPAPTWADAGQPAYLGAAREPDGSFALFGVSAAGADIFRIALPGRGHAAVAHPSAPEAVAFARRPGTFALVVDCLRGDVLRRLEAPSERHFYGHGAFVEGGDVLCTTENDIATGGGVIGLWSRRDGYARVGEVASGGIGPHEIRTLPDGSLVVANGGILTRPERGREKLNLDTMRPNLAFLSASGRVAETMELAPELHLNSIRHLAVAPDGLVAFAMQWQGDKLDPVPLLGIWRRGSRPRLASAGLAEQIAMQGYAGSVAFDGAGETVAITAPAGRRLHRFSADGAFLAAERCPDVCGVAPSPDGFVASDGLGALLGVNADGPRILSRSNRAWDNHLVSIARR